VYNLVTGYGSIAGEAIRHASDVDMSPSPARPVPPAVSALGRRDSQAVALELGGKSANVVLPDADLTAAVKSVLAISC